MDLDGDDDESVYEPEEDDDYEGGLAYEAIIDDDEDDLVDDEPAVVEPLKIGRLATRDDDQSLTIPERVPRPRPADDLSVEERETNRDSTRSSTSTLNAQTMATAAIVRNVSVARRAGAYVIDNRSPSVSSFVDSKSPVHTASSSISGMRTNTPPLSLGRPPPSSLGTAENGGGSPGSVSSGSPSLENPTPTTTDDGIASPLLYYLDGTQTPSPTPDKMSFDQVRPPPSRRLPPMKEEEYDEDAEFDDGQQLATYPTEAAVQAYLNAAGSPTPSRPTIVISDVPTPSADRGQQTAGTASSNATPLSPFQRYRGWLSAVVAPLEEFIDEAVDPRDHYLDLSEIAEGESGSVFAARLNHENATKLRLPPLIKAQDNDEIMQGRDRLVAIKSVAIVPSGSPKLQDLQRELSLMRGLWHENVLGMDGVYVDLVEDSLWVRMELMERSLADVIGLVGEGLTLPDRIIARFASDVLLALEYLSKHNITHRDVRSDNLLINKHGVLKLADFSNAVQVTREAPMRSEIVGVAFWQAPEVRRPPYNALKIDVWSLGATVWEMAQTEPPFADTQQLAERWPPLRQPELYSPAFHDFLRKCSEPAASRPSAAELLKTPFVNNACGRPVMVQLLSQCMAIEKLLQEGGA